MSVVNKMLRDLEQRKHQVNQSNYVPPSNKRNMKLMISAVVLMGLASGVTYGLVGERVTHSINTSSDDKPPIEYHPEEGHMISQSMVSEPINVDGDTDSTAHLSQVEQLPEQSVTQTEEQPLIAMTKNAEISEDKIENSLKDSPSPESESVVKDDEVEAFASSDKMKETKLVVAPSDGNSKQLSSLREAARIALEKGQDARAIQLLTQILERAPEDISTRKQLASLQYANKLIAEAFKTLHIGIQMSPEDSSMRLMQARLAFRQGDIALATDILEKHTNLAVASDKLLSFRAALSEKIGNYTLAKTDYQALIQRQPENAKWWLGLAVSQDKLRLPEQAIASYQQAFTLNQLPNQVQTFVKQRIALLAGQP